MRNRLKFLPLLFFIVPTMCACGKFSTPLTDREREKLQNLENTDLRVRELKPVLGRYTGHPDTGGGLYLAREDRWIQFELILTLYNTPHLDPKNVDTSIVPHLTGSAKQWIEGTNTYISWQIEYGDYEQETGTLYITFKDGAATLEGKIENDTLTAVWNASTRANASGKVVLRKER